MKELELREIYADACETKGYEPDTAQFKIWRSTLEWCDPRDLREALSRWWQDNTNLPMPSELRPLVDVAMRIRKARATAHVDFVVWKCPVCSSTLSGWPQGTDNRRWCGAFRKTGGICNTLMVEFLREAA